jgi:glyoxylase-like metal-dependent hydrolase (beta-lactamase superfamily II)
MKRIFWIASFVLLLGCGQRQIQDYHSPNFELVKLTDGVFACIHKFGGKAICNAGIIDNGRETIIFDTFLSPGVAEEFHTIIEQYGLSPVRYVVNSHAHNDHIRGNQVFSEDAEIISTRRTTELIEEWETGSFQEEKEYAPPLFAHWDSLYNAFKGDTSSREFARILMWKPFYEVLAESYLKVKTRLPNLFVEDQMNVDGPDRRVQLIAGGAGHTESDMILYLPDDQILFAGDLVFYEMHPYMGQGIPDDWVKYLNYMETLDIHTLVPGHGQVCGREGITATKAYIHSIDSLVYTMIDKDMGIERIPEIRIPDPYKTWWFDDFFPSNLHTMYMIRISQN